MRGPWGKPAAESRIETATWGALVLWIGLMLASKEAPGVAPIGVGAILLGSAVLQRVLGYRAGVLLWGFGIYFLLKGLDERTGFTVRESLLGAILVAIGILILIRAFSRTRRRSLHIVRGPTLPPD